MVLLRLRLRLLRLLQRRFVFRLGVGQLLVLLAQRRLLPVDLLLRRNVAVQVEFKSKI